MTEAFVKASPLKRVIARLIDLLMRYAFMFVASIPLNLFEFFRIHYE